MGGMAPTTPRHTRHRRHPPRPPPTTPPPVYATACRLVDVDYRIKDLMKYGVWLKYIITFTLVSGLIQVGVQWK